MRECAFTCVCTHACVRVHYVSDSRTKEKKEKHEHGVDICQLLAVYTACWKCDMLCIEAYAGC